MGWFASNRGKKPEQIIGVIYVCEIIKNRIDSSTLQSYKAVQQFLAEDAAKNMVVVTTKWDLVNKLENNADALEEAEERHRQLEEKSNLFKEVLKRGGSMKKRKQEGDTKAVIETIINKYLPKSQG
jgi:predicted GTPase